jgi:hypothetical protein
VRASASTLTVPPKANPGASALARFVSAKTCGRIARDATQVVPQLVLLLRDDERIRFDGLGTVGEAARAAVVKPEAESTKYPASLRARALYVCLGSLVKRKVEVLRSLV